MVPLHTYGLELIACRLMASLDGVADRSRSFYEAKELIPDEIDAQSSGNCKGQSWSDRLNDRPLRPSHQLFRLWRQKWLSQARGSLQSLLFACILGGCNLKVELGQSMATYTDCPTNLNPLLLATGLIALLREESVAENFNFAVHLMSCALSHKTFRAAGRPPPHYGGHLDFPLEAISGE